MMEYWNSNNYGKSKSEGGGAIYLIILLILIGGIGFWIWPTYLKPIKIPDITYLRISINPDFVFGVDEEGNVVSFSPINEDAEELYTLEMFEGKSYEEALDYAIEYAQENNVLDPNTTYEVSVTVISDTEETTTEYEDNIVRALTGNFVAKIVEPTDEELSHFSKVGKQVASTQKRNRNEKEVIKIEMQEFQQVYTSEKNKVSDESCDYTKVSVDDLSSTDRYSTAVEVSKKLYDKSDYVVLTSGTSIADAYPAIGLAAKYNAPVLFAPAKQTSNDSTLIEIKRLRPKTIFVLGGEDVVSKDYVNKVVSSLKDSGIVVNIERFSGDCRYATSVLVADKIIDDNQTSSVMIVPSGNNQFVDAAMASSISANSKSNMPILFMNTDRSSWVEYKGSENISYHEEHVIQYLNEHKNIKKIYVVSDLFSKEVIKELEKTGKEIVELDDETQKLNRVGTNINLIKKFNEDYSNIVYVSNTVDLVPASLFAAKNNAALILVEKEITDKQIETLISNKSIKNIYFFGGDSIDKYSARNFILKVKTNNMKVNNCYVVDNNSSDNQKAAQARELMFSTEQAVFYVPHQDDETIYYQQIITSAIDELGADNVHIVLLTDGAGSGLIKEGGALYGMEPAAFTKARDTEFKEALNQLSGNNSKLNIYDTDDAIFKSIMGSVRFKDGSSFANYSTNKGTYNDNLNKMKEIMMYFDKEYGQNITHFGFSYSDCHTDHAAIGKALNDLYFDIDRDKTEYKSYKMNSFENVYLIHRRDVKVDLSSSNYIYVFDSYRDYVNTESTNKRMKDALDMFKADSNLGLLGIGYQSVGSLIDATEKAIDCGELTTPIFVPSKPKSITPTNSSNCSNLNTPVCSTK